ncbi:MAG: DUF86 domain-containing protein, partial [Gammaproteobacteria bacterium]
MGEVFDTLCDLNIINQQTASNMKRAVGFRNIAVHGYNKIDFTIVYSIITEQIQDF